MFSRKRKWEHFMVKQNHLFWKKKKITKNDHKAHEKRKKKKKRTRKLERLDNNTPIIFSYHLIIVKRKKNEI